jgi:hypothetical protein
VYINRQHIGERSFGAQTPWGHISTKNMIRHVQADDKQASRRQTTLATVYFFRFSFVRSFTVYDSRRGLEEHCGSPRVPSRVSVPA